MYEVAQTVLRRSGVKVFHAREFRCLTGACELIHKRMIHGAYYGEFGGRNTYLWGQFGQSPILNVEPAGQGHRFGGYRRDHPDRRIRHRHWGHNT